MSVIGHGVEIVDSVLTRPVGPVEGTLIYQKDTNQLLLWDGAGWVTPMANQSAGGDLTGTYPNPSVAANEAWRVIGSAGNPGFQTGWSNYSSGYSSARFKKDRQNTVFIDGLVRNGSNTIFTLPAGYRPVSGRMIFAVQTNPNVVGRLDIDTSGNLLPISFNSTWLSIVLSFKAE